MGDFTNLIENCLKNKKRLSFIEKLIRLLYSGIKESENINEANRYFKALEELQFIMAKSVFKENLYVTNFIRKFIYNFDRIDDEEVKIYLYNKIKNEDA